MWVQKLKETPSLFLLNHCAKALKDRSWLYKANTDLIPFMDS